MRNWPAIAKTGFSKYSKNFSALQQSNLLLPANFHFEVCSAELFVLGFYKLQIDIKSGWLLFNVCISDSESKAFQLTRRVCLFRYWYIRFPSYLLTVSDWDANLKTSIMQPNTTFIILSSSRNAKHTFLLFNLEWITARLLFLIICINTRSRNVAVKLSYWNIATLNIRLTLICTSSSLARHRLNDSSDWDRIEMGFLGFIFQCNEHDRAQCSCLGHNTGEWFRLIYLMLKRCDTLFGLVIHKEWVTCLMNIDIMLHI